MGGSPNIPAFATVSATALSALCARHHIRSIRVFGSAARNELNADSDIDVLIEFEQGIDPDLFELGGLQQDLTDLLGRDVDLKTPAMFTEANLRRIMGSSVMAYAA